jgi:hypothetical protein
MTYLIQGILNRPATSCIRSEFLLEAAQSIAIFTYYPRSSITPESLGDAPQWNEIDAESVSAGQQHQRGEKTQFLYIR